jgi:hypothetical protein
MMLTIETPITLGTKMHGGFAASNRQMSEADFTIFIIQRRRHLSTSMTRAPLNRAFDGDVKMTDPIRRHRFNRHIGDIQWHFKGMAHGSTHFFVF